MILKLDRSKVKTTSRRRHSVTLDLLRKEGFSNAHTDRLREWDSMSGSYALERDESPWN